MATIDLADTLDLSRLPPFSLTTPDFDTILSARLASLKARLALPPPDGPGIDWDVSTSQLDPFVMLQQEDAYRELLDLTALNDAGRGLSIAYAQGAALDHLAATYYADLGLRRLPGELDDPFRNRIALAPEAKSAGSLGGYEFQALSADAGVKDALALNAASGQVRAGQVLIVILGALGADPAALVDAVRARVLDRDVKLATDDVRIAAASLVTYDVTATIEVPRGPDPSLALAQAKARLTAYAEDRRRVGDVVALSGLDAALHVPVANRVRRSAPMADVEPGPTSAAVLGQVNVTIAPYA